MPELAVIVPTRGRPENVRKVIDAWTFTGAWNHAELHLGVDADDPRLPEYLELVNGACVPGDGEIHIGVHVVERWMPMVPKLNQVAVTLASTGRYFALGFAGDDHLPRTINWAHRYLTVLHDLGTGMVYGDDGYQGVKLSTEWAVTSDVVRELGRMVPAPVDHLYCDNAIMDLFSAAGALRHLPEVRVEHMHPSAGKAPGDDQYRRVNSRDQFHSDGNVYRQWRRGALAAEAAVVRRMRAGRSEVRPVPIRPVRPVTVPNRRRSMAIAPKTLRRVKGATPDEIGVALADMAIQVPSDQAIVELGVYQGRTALLMSWGARQGHGAHVWGVDPWDLPGNVYDPPFTDAGSRNWARYNVRATGYANHVTLIQGFSHDVATSWDGPEVGLLFVDGDHTKAGARRDIEVWMPHLASGAVIAVDDYGHPDWPGVAEAVDELVAEGTLEPIKIFHDRLAVTRVAEKTDTPRAVTSEGVSPSPDTAESIRRLLEHLDDVVPAPDADGFTDGSRAGDPRESEEYSDHLVGEGELEGVTAGTPVESLTLPHLKALAKSRGIVLGARKDRKADILDAIRGGS